MSRPVLACICIILCILYAAVTWSAVCTKCATYDEPFHIAVGWLMRHRGDYRAGLEAPALWEKWIALSLGSEALHPDTGSLQQDRTVREDVVWASQTLYQSRGIDPIAIVKRARVMALLLAIGLGAVIFWWTRAMAGPAAAILATAAWALDPNFIAHGALVKNDVPLALFWTGMTAALWMAGRKVTVGTSAVLCLSVALALGTKLTGLLCGPAVVGVLMIRAMIGRAWPVFGRPVKTLAGRVAVAVALCALVAGVSLGVLWASYGFRFNAGPGGPHGNAAYLFDATRYWDVYHANGWVRPTAGQLAAWRPDVASAAMQVALEHHLLPEAWCEGFLRLRVGMFARQSFLCGQIYRGGRWSYFPLAFVFKTPLATLAGLVLLLLVVRRFRPSFDLCWAAIAMFVPFVLFALSAMGSSMDLGVRYILPLYPPLFILLGIGGAMAWESRRRVVGRGLIVVLVAGLVGESAIAYPDYISFFNAACGDATHRMWLLSDSNIDWGQDLPLLAEWQRSHPGERLYLQYTATCDPAAYGIRYVNLPGGYFLGPPPQWPDRPGTIAISVTALQQPTAGSAAALYSRVVPDEVLGGSIALFEFEGTKAR